MFCFYFRVRPNTMEGNLNPESDPDFLESYMRQMMSSLEGLKTKVNELNLEEGEDDKRGRTRRKSILKKTQGKKAKESSRVSSEAGSASEVRSSGSEVQVVRKNRSRSRRRRRSRDRSSGRRSRSRSRRSRSTSSSCDEIVVKEKANRRRKSKVRKRSAKEDKEEIEKLIGEVLKKSVSCTDVINRGGKVRVHVDGYPTIVLQGEEKKKKRGESKKGGSSKKTVQSTDDYDSDDIDE